jgi:hypothetical protein
MRIKSAGKCALTLAPVALALAVPVQAYAAEGDSWLCKYFPKYCGSETDPGGLPGHAAPDSGEAESSRGISDPYEAAKPSAPAPESPEPPPPPAEPPKDPQ